MCDYGDRNVAVSGPATPNDLGIPGGPMPFGVHHHSGGGRLANPSHGGYSSVPKYLSPSRRGTNDSMNETPDAALNSQAPPALPLLPEPN